MGRGDILSLGCPGQCGFLRGADDLACGVIRVGMIILGRDWGFSPEVKDPSWTDHDAGVGFVSSDIASVLSDVILVAFDILACWLLDTIFFFRRILSCFRRILSDTLLVFGNSFLRRIPQCL